MKLRASSCEGAAALGPLRSFVTDYFDRRRVPRQPGGLRPRAGSTVQKIESVGRAAERSKGGGVGRRPAPGDMSAAACPGGSIPRQHWQGLHPTTATGRKRTAKTTAPSDALRKSLSAMGH